MNKCGEIIRNNLFLSWAFPEEQGKCHGHKPVTIEFDIPNNPTSINGLLLELIICSSLIVAFAN